MLTGSNESSIKPPHTYMHAHACTNTHIRTRTCVRAYTHKYDHKIGGFTSILEGGPKHYSIYNQALKCNNNQGGFSDLEEGFYKEI